MQNCRRGSKSEVQIPFIYFSFCGDLLLASILFVQSPFLLRPILTYPHLSTVLRASTQQSTRYGYQYQLLLQWKSTLAANCSQDISLVSFRSAGWTILIDRSYERPDADELHSANNSSRKVNSQIFIQGVHTTSA